MRTKDLIDLADNPDFISGVYNYCDRWCERCPFTARCLLYATESEDRDDLQSQDIRNAEFWHKLESVSQQAKEMITAWAEKNCVDMSDVSLESEIEEDRLDLERAEDHELSIAARNYATSVNEWFEAESIQLQGVDDRERVARSR